ncbi:Abi family protein [Massilibacteroides vaginae]|uniref:Abi family protein n=1 Tax=Massilibacteroides vaginae TaxID=1673718 RepID=UPI0021CED0D3|nr:Abi family protein [Massilibacteroides vaginae]
MAKSFGIPSERTFCSWLHVINYVRNISAHHARLWNIKFAIQPNNFPYGVSDSKTHLKCLYSHKSHYLYGV